MRIESEGRKIQINYLNYQRYPKLKFDVTLSIQNYYFYLS